MDTQLIILLAGFIAAVSMAAIKAWQSGGYKAALRSVIRGIEYIDLPKDLTPEETLAALKRNIERISSRMNTGKVLDREVDKVTRLVSRLEQQPTQKKPTK